MSLKVDKKVWEAMKKKFRQADSIQLSVGFFEEDRYGPENENLPVAYIARIQDAGLGPPARPFMSGAQGLTGVVRSAPYKKDYQEAARRIILNLSSVQQEYAKLGTFLVQDTKEIIEQWSSPPNAALTVELKGFNDPLIETETMKNSVKFKIEKG